MKRISHLTKAEEITLLEMYKKGGTHRLRQRAHILLMSYKGMCLQQISLVVDLESNTISRTLDLWESQGIGGLYDRPRSGRPELFTGEEKRDIITLISEEPRQLKQAIALTLEKTQKSASLQTIRRIAKGSGLVWKRIKKVVFGRPDPIEYLERKALLEQLQERQLQGEISLYYEDESGFSLTPKVPYAWQPIGTQLTVPTSRGSQINVLGFLGGDNDWKSMTFNCSINAECIISAIEELFPSVSKETWFVMDNSPPHKSDKMKAKIAQWKERKIHVLFLPTYSPQLNLIEIVWRFIKYHWMPFSAYSSFKSLSRALNDILSNYGSKYLVTFG